jgi:predicted ATPase/class 3 adenylate cyclase
MSAFKPQERMPENVAAKMHAARASRTMRGERRVITMLFCDVTGSTAMAENLDPEEWAEIMNEAFDYMVRPIYLYEGTVARMMGDGVLAFFGAPIAHEDDPQRAVLSGLEIVRGISTFAGEIEEDYNLDFNVRVGINTGPVVVGDIGSDLALEYTAMGDAINLAARMEQTAEPGTVQIAADTYNLVAPLFDVEPLGGVSVKGKETPVEAYQIIGRKLFPGRLRGIEGLDAKLVGREVELDTYRQALENLKQGQGQVLTLVGEAGLGKSRLLREMRLIWETEGGDKWNWSESQAAPYEITRPYSLISDYLRRTFAIEREDPLQVVREKIASALAHYSEDERNLSVQAVEAIIGAYAGYEEPQLKAETIRQTLFDMAYRECLIAGERHAYVMVYDDLHWSDPASSDLLIHMLQLVEVVPILVILATRPYRESAGWRVVETAATDYAEYHRELALPPLSDQETNELVDRLLAISDLPVELRHLILNKTDGNPFFVEEIVRTLIETSAIERDESGMQWQATIKVEDIDIPSNVQSLLMSRIDRLQKDTRHTLQLASVIGRAFYHRILEAIANRAASLASDLEQLQQHELILESARIPELEYMFRHELSRDAAYKTILRRQRRRYHRQVGEALERLMPDRVSEESPRLAYHFDEAGDKVKALNYYKMAAESAARLYANEEAIKHYQRALQLADRSEISDQELIELHHGFGRVFEVSGRYDEAIQIYETLLELGREKQLPSMEVGALMALAPIYGTYTSKYDVDQTLEILDQALKLAETEKDHEAEAKIYWNLMMTGTYSFQDEQKNIEYGERSLSIAREYNLQEQLAYTLNDLTRAYAAAGNIKLATTAVLEAGKLFREMGNQHMLTDNLTTAAEGFTYWGKLDKALDLVDESIAVSRRIGNTWGLSYGYAVRFEIMILLGQFDDALFSFKQAIEYSIRANFLGAQVRSPTMLAQLYLELGDIENATLYTSQSADIIETHENTGSEVFAILSKAGIKAKEGKLTEANTLLKEVSLATREVRGAPEAFMYYGQIKCSVALLEQDFLLAFELANDISNDMERLNFLVGLPMMRYFRGRALIGLGRLPEAKVDLEQALDQSRNMNIRFQRLRIIASLSDLIEDEGNLVHATGLRDEAKQDIAYIAEHISDEKLRSIFLNQPEIRNLKVDIS